MARRVQLDIPLTSWHHPYIRMNGLNKSTTMSTAITTPAIPPSTSTPDPGVTSASTADAQLGSAILDRMSTLADPLRCRMLLVLENHELSVSELCSVLQLPQSTASRHLKMLADEGWVGVRREGTSRLYQASQQLDGSAHKLWLLVREQLADSPATQQDRHRLDGVLAERRSASQAFFSSAAGEWARLRRELFGDSFDLHALLGLLDPEWVVGDLGCGSGELSLRLAPFVGRVVAVDDSEAMLKAARAALDGLDNVDVRPGHLESLPMTDGELDAAVLSLVLHHLPEPPRVLAEVARVLRPGGRVLIVDMLPHEHEEYRQQMGHVWLGVQQQQLGQWLQAVGLTLRGWTPLPVQAESRGPALFAATALKP